MQKSGAMIVVSGLLIVAGLVLLVVGNQIILDGVSQQNGAVSIGEELAVAAEFGPETATGVYAVQVMDYRDGVFSARVLDPSGIEISSYDIDSETIEKEFEIGSPGAYSLVIQSSSNEEVQVFGAIGPLPDAGKKSLGFLSSYVLIVGMIGLVVSGIYGIRNKKRNQLR